MTMAIVDTMMVGRQADSAEAIGAVSLGSILFNAVAIFGTGLMLGLDTLVSHSYGAGDVEDCHRSLVNGVYLSLAITPFLMGIVRLFEPVLRSLDIQASVLNQAIPYLRALNWRHAAAAAVLCFSPVSPGHEPGEASDVRADFRELREPRGELGARVRSSRDSGDGDCGFGMVHLCGADLYDECDARLRGVLRSSLSDGASRDAAAAEFLRMWKLVQLGFPAATQFGMEVGVFAVCTALIAKLGAVPLASHQVALNTVSLTYMVPLGIASAAAVRVGQALGRGDPHGASRAGWTALALGTSFMFCMGVILFLIPDPISRIYTPDPVVIHAAGVLFT